MICRVADHDGEMDCGAETEQDDVARVMLNDANSEQAMMGSFNVISSFVTPNVPVEEYVSFQISL